MHNIDKIKFSVVIPTRERCNTLDASIRTCITQNYDNFEIIISDNFSQDDTKELVNSFKDKRILYINTGKRVSMSENWEFGLSQVTGDFVIFLGDDDGLLPGALNDLNEIINQLGCNAICWHGASYYWPCCEIDRAKNILTVPLTRKLYKYYTDKMLRDVLSFNKSIYLLPSIYRGAISNKIIKHIKNKSGGKFYHSLSPDFYSAIVISAAVDTYYYSTKPYSVFGQSQHSMGASFLYSKKQNNTTAEYIFFNEPNLPSHDNIMLGPSVFLVMANAFMQAREKFDPLKNYNINIRELIRKAMNEVAHGPREKYDKVATAITYIAEKNILTDFAESILKNMKNVPKKNVGIDVPGYNIVRRHFTIDCRNFGVRDVYQASLLCKLILEHKNSGMGLSLPSVIRTTITLAKNYFQRWQGRNRS